MKEVKLAQGKLEKEKKNKEGKLIKKLLFPVKMKRSLLFIFVSCFIFDL